MSGRLGAERPYTVGSLFAGIGGIDLAFEAADFELRWQVEIEDFPRQVLERHWPGLLRPRDVRGCTGRSGKGWRRYQRLPRVDVLVGGFPCQDISVAGKGAGIRAGTRSGLWFEFARLIGELRPRVVLLENVPAITTRDGTVVIGSLAELGYDARWGLIRASDAGAPHQRERWFCVADADSGRHESAHAGKGRGLPHINRDGAAQERGRHKLESWTGVHGEELADTDCRRQQQRDAGIGRLSEPHAHSQNVVYAEHCGREGGQSDGRGAGAAMPSGSARSGAIPESRVGRIADGLSARLDGPVYRWPAGPGQPQHAWEPPRVTSGQPDRTKRLKALGNAVVPQVVYPLAVAIREWLQAQDADTGESDETTVARTPDMGARVMHALPRKP
ncbi:MAG: DNA cytosine methyltransferase [Bryobacterales bacterium]|nr:DNA cytosine methyltransferase [Bryobacterales bacterium]